MFKIRKLIFLSLFVCSALATNEPVDVLPDLPRVGSSEDKQGCVKNSVSVENSTQCDDVEQSVEDKKATKVRPVNKKSSTNKWVTMALGTAGLLTCGTLLSLAMSGHGSDKSSLPIAPPASDPATPTPTVHAAPNPAPQPLMQLSTFEGSLPEAIKKIEFSSKCDNLCDKFLTGDKGFYTHVEHSKASAFAAFYAPFGADYSGDAKHIYYEIINEPDRVKRYDKLWGLFGGLNFDNNEQQKQEARKAFGVRFKIHLQIKPEYINNFIYNFAKYYAENGLNFDISEFKYVSKYEEHNHTGEAAYPMIVLYLYDRVFSNKSALNEHLNSRIDELNVFIDKYCSASHISRQDLAWPHAPRMNYKINDIVYIAGGDADYKVYYKERWTTVGILYTPDFNFVTGFEYQYIPPALRGANPQ
ncbi:MAG: hypothetical protein US22_C0051G0003 [candidate division TM6 bacterium GW2011_GWF2_36_6]|nr:MAG: hypothetical protein US22_C0051G0003 [candidate division TM6 bacterium GW2011_GWF2_36_6]